MSWGFFSPSIQNFGPERRSAPLAEFNRPVEVEVLAQIARMNLLLNRKEEGRKWLEEAETKASESDPMGWSRFLGVKGRFQW